MITQYGLGLAEQCYIAYFVCVCVQGIGLAFVFDDNNRGFYHKEIDLSKVFYILKLHPIILHR
jgi:hypothetical protein